MFGLLENKVRLKGGVGPGGEVPEAFHQRLGVLLLQVDSPRRQPRRKGIELSYSDRALRAVQQVFPGPLFIEYRLRRLLDSPGSVRRKNAFSDGGPKGFSSEERRVGQACVSSCRSRWSP